MGSLARLLTVSWGPEGNHELEEGDADLLEESLRWRQHRGELSWQRPRL